MSSSIVLNDWTDSRHIYLSPHLDDAILSCGGMIFSQVGAGESVTVITVFAGSAPEDSPLSPIAIHHHERWGASVSADTDFSDPYRVRREEDIRAFGVISEKITVRHLPLLDCIYRNHPTHGEVLYPEVPDIFGDIHPDDPSPDDLASFSAVPHDATLYLPAGIGEHVDHLLVRDAVEHWQVKSNQLRYYADYPYAANVERIREVDESRPTWDRVTVLVNEDALSAKIRGIGQHRSQVSTFWDNDDQMAAAVRAYDTDSGGEILWQFNG